MRTQHERRGHASLCPPYEGGPRCGCCSAFCSLRFALASPARRRRHAEDRGRPARLVGYLGRGARPARRHLQEARHRARHPLHPGRRRDPAGGDLRQCRARRVRRRARRVRRLFEGRAAAHHRRRDDGRRRPLLVRAVDLADPLADRHRRQDHRLFDQRRLDPRDRQRVPAPVRPQGEAGRDRQPGGDADPGDVRPGRCRLGRAAVRPRSHRPGQDPHHRVGQRCERVPQPDGAAPHHQCGDARGAAPCHRAFHGGVPRDGRLDVRRPGGVQALFRFHRRQRSDRPTRPRWLLSEGRARPRRHRRRSTPSTPTRSPSSTWRRR